MHEEECPLATDLETPFWLKVACPNYSLVSRHPDRYCGTGAYYCGKTPDGEQLNRVHAAHTKAHANAQRIEESISGEGGLKEYGQLLAKKILEEGVGREDAKRDPRMVPVLEAVSRYALELANVKRHENYLAATIQNAKQYFAQQARWISGVGPPVAQMSQGMCPPPFQTEVQRPRRLANLGGGGERLRIRPAPQSDVSTLASQHFTPFSIPEVQAYARRLSEVQAPQRFISRPQKTLQRPSVQEEEAPPERPSPPVRRSARVRTKKIVYAESESDPFSRTPSPVKSDAADSSFSPSTRQATPPSKKPGPTKSSSSNMLVDMIGDWKKRDLDKKSVDSLQREVPKYLSWKMASLPKPETMKWNVNRGETDASIPAQNQAAPASLPQTWNFKLNRFDPPQLPRNPSEATSKTVDYASMKQAFNAPTTLLAQTQIQRRPIEEPQKRRLPPQAPIEGSSSKRPKLGDTPAPVLAPTVTRRSIPVKEALPEPEEDVPTLENDPGVATDDDSTLSDIDWNVLEEGILEN